MKKTSYIIFSIFFLASCKKDPPGKTSSDESANYSVTTVAGNGMIGTADGIGTDARFNFPTGVVFDQQGNLFVTDAGNFSIRKITTAGLVSTLAGGQQGYAEGTGNAAQFFNTVGLTIDATGNIYAADVTRIRKVTPAGVVTTLAGTTTIGNADGTGASAIFSAVRAITIDQQGTIYVLDNSASGSLIRKISLAGVVTTFYSHNKLCSSIAVDGQGNVFVNEIGILEDIIQKISVSKVITKFATVPPCRGMYINSQNVFYMIGYSTDFTYNLYKVYKLNTTGQYITIAGNRAGFADGDGNIAQFSQLSGISADASGNIFIADGNNNRIRKVKSK